MKNIPFIFFSIIGSFCIFLLAVTFYSGYQQSFVILNKMRVPLLDTFSLWLTEFGNGFYLVIFALILACANKKYWNTALNIIICIMLTTIVVQLCKQVFFPDWHRPAKLLQDKPIYILLNPVPHHNSFPSGHSISIMSAVTVLSFTFSSYISQIFFALMACIVAYTRIYVGAHFPADVAVGSLLGLIISLIVLYRLRSLNLSQIQKKSYSLPVLYAITILCLIIALIQAK